MMPISTKLIHSYHGHIYFRSAAERQVALKLRDWIADRFLVQLGDIHDEPVGPHTAPMFVVVFEPRWFGAFVQWMALNREGLSVLVHPNSGQERIDHMHRAFWLGTPISLREEALSDEWPLEPVIINTIPTRALE